MAEITEVGQRIWGEGMEEREREIIKEIEKFDVLSLKKRIQELEQQLADTVKLMQKARDKVVPLRFEVKRLLVVNAEYKRQAIKYANELEELKLYK